MDEVKPGYVEFLDLSDIEEQERTWILSSLHSWNPNIKLPWTNEDGEAKDPEPPYLPQKRLNASYGQQETAPPIPSPFVPHEQPICYLNNSTVNYNNENSDVYANTQLEDGNVQGFTNGTAFENSSATETGDPIIINNGCKETKTYDTEQNGSVASFASSSSPPLPVPPAAPKSWASLFNKSQSAEQPAATSHYQKDQQGPGSDERSPLSVPVRPRPDGVKSSANNASPKIHLREPFQSNADDPNLHRMGEFLAAHNVDNHVTSLQPRGLINRSNYCYINSILQALLACPPLYNLLEGLSRESSSCATEKKKITPTIDSVTLFMREFQYLPAGMRVSRRLDKNQKKDYSVSLNCDVPFEPFWMHKLLSGMRSDTFVVEGRQEDAEEFLGCLLNGLNDEMLELMKLAGGRSTVHNDGDINHEQHSFAPDEDKEWQVMGPKNKGAITRRTEFSRTPISDVFGGLLRSRLHRSGDQSTDNIQPFFTLQLNIEKVTTVREALDALVCKNQLEGVTSSKTNEEVEAWQQVTIEELPIVLVLHLKCFDYKLDGCSKIIKALEFPIDLKIDSKMLSSKMNYTAKEKQYKLFAVVYHEGKEATKGHYVTDAYHIGYASWLRYDDASVKAIPEEHVLKPHGTRVPYLLFYRRSDSLNKTNK